MAEDLLRELYDHQVIIEMDKWFRKRKRGSGGVTGSNKSSCGDAESAAEKGMKAKGAA